MIGLATEHQHYTTSREWKFWFVLTDKYNMALCVKHNDISGYLLLEEVRLCGHYSGSCVRRGERKTQLVLQEIIYIQYQWSRSDSASFCHMWSTHNTIDVKSRETDAHSCGWTESRLLRVERYEDNEENNSWNKQSALHLDQLLIGERDNWSFRGQCYWCLHRYHSDPKSQITCE